MTGCDGSWNRVVKAGLAVPGNDLPDDCFRRELLKPKLTQS